MKYPPRTIALLCELFHPPLEPNPVHVQRVHNELFQTPDPAYKSFAVSPNGAVLSNPVTRPGEVSMAAFMPDRFQFREELTSLTVDEFQTKLNANERLNNYSVGALAYYPEAGETSAGIYDFRVPATTDGEVVDVLTGVLAE